MAPRLSNTVVTILNIFSLFIGVAAISFGIYFHVQGDTQCQRSLENPSLIIGVSIFVVSLLGLIGSCCKANLMLDVYIFCLSLLIIGLMVFTIFVFAVTNKSAGKTVSSLGFEEKHEIDDYFTHWLQDHFVGGKRWNEITRCMADAHICKRLSSNIGIHAVDYYKKHLWSLIQSGCCKPPIYCGFKSENATSWKAPKSGPAVPDSDCKAWSNRQEVLCYKCKSCKVGVVANIRMEWRLLGICNVALIVFVMIIFSTVLCARENNRSYKVNKYRGYF